jgi:hypothetical protein
MPHRTRHITRLAVAGVAAFMAAPALAEPRVSVTLTPPAEDVWVYTFGQGAFATAAPTFAGDFSDPFPDRFGTLFLTFDATGLLPDSDRPVRLNGFILELSMLNSSTFDQNNGIFYDPTYDPVATYIDPNADTDPGRPVELYAVGYRNGFIFETWRDANYPVTGPDGYNAVPIDFPADTSTGRFVDDSVSNEFDTLPLATGTTPDLLEATDGTLRVLDLARWSFDASALNPAERDFFTSQLESGSISFMVSSLQLAGFDGMGGDEIYPRFATLETIFPVEEASVELDFEVSPPADVNTDFGVDIEDLYAWEQDSGLRDVDENGIVDDSDRAVLLAALRADELDDTTR